ncbi:MAG: di-trans,poly-cis-decaprenylcistransferase [Pseudomonadota bacterium]|jgi:undecaprenyl diphosphate synthase
MHNNFNIPSHISIILDGNGRWAKKRFLPRVAGHIKGVQSVKKTVKACLKYGVKYLTLFAFSSENWKRPADEVSFLMGLLQRTLKREANDLKQQGIYLRIIGDISNLPSQVHQILKDSLDNQISPENARLNLTVAINYGGRWDITNAFSQWIKHNINTIDDINHKKHPTPEEIEPYLSMYGCPEPDLMIRTGGEQRISNFLLWQMAYTELYFTQEFWPEFNEDSLVRAMQSYSSRERRFGKTSEQISSNK